MPFAKPAKSPANTLVAPRLAENRSFDAVELEEEPQADVGTQLSQATQFGHSLACLQPIRRQVGADPELDEEEETPIQAKLTIGQPGDKYEQEADQMATKVMAMPDSAVQREAMPEEEDELQAQPQLQREAMPEEDEALQMRPQLQLQTTLKDDDTLQIKPQNSKLKPQNSKSPFLQAKGDAPSAPANFDHQLARHNGSGQPLSDETRAFMEPRFGEDFSNVRVHETPDLANAIQAKAFTHGQDIYFNSGKYNPGSSGGKDLLAHELTHVMQQQGKGSIRCSSSEKQESQTFWNWYSSASGQQYQKLRQKLERLNYKFYTRIAIGTNPESSLIWGYGFPKDNTLSEEVAWSIKHPEDSWSWATTKNIVSKCMELQSKQSENLERNETVRGSATSLSWIHENSPAGSGV
ncbi:MAG: DUF4157 domain-containing protein, partial [Cyanobacteria bacterium P01_D01_bin.115]